MYWPSLSSSFDEEAAEGASASSVEDLALWVNRCDFCNEEDSPHGDQ